MNEQLEKVKYETLGIEGSTNELVISIDNYDYLIRQAELANEKDTKTILKIAEKLEHSQQENIKLAKENKRYREAIEKALAECVKDRPITAENILAKALEEEPTPKSYNDLTENEKLSLSETLRTWFD